ncbi:LysR substrate-binding domain-containing protein [Dyella telluris]|uniref:LysR family transcriptional regulator n=1 Tax=Dyella telluris TaxID=2763498 RepID=A0A7G8Q5S7_9GAMM|nr:LysR substrate-binding domain-containing protein [Dyella telluris]QNK02135.1 LysR family transcriptional regulator [Dyella telluris]
MPRTLPPMHTLSTFECVSRLRSFTAAAEELHLTVSAVSHQIRSLETFYGTRLLQRGHRDVTLTKAGDMLCSVVEELLEKLGTVGRALRSQPGNRLSLSAPPSFVSRWLMPRLAGFLDAHPDIDFTLKATTELVDLENDEVDFAIRYGDGTWPGLQGEKLLDEELFAVASPAYLEKAGIRDAKDLGKGLLLRDDFFSWAAWLGHMGMTDVATPSGPVYGDSSLLLQAAEEGHGIALGRSVLVETALASGRLARAGSKALKVDRSYYLVRSLAMPSSPTMELFRAWLFAQAQRLPA